LQPEWSRVRDKHSIQLSLKSSADCHRWGTLAASRPAVFVWRRRKDGDKYDIVITDNKTAPNIPVAGAMEAIA
jgi:hypothetical protein